MLERRSITGGTETRLRAATRSADPKDGVVGRDAPYLLLRRVRPDPPEELAGLPLPLAQVGAQQVGLLGVLELDGGEVLGAPADVQLAGAAHAQVPHPLGVPARGDQVAPVLERHQVDRRAARLSGLAAPHLEDARAPPAQAEPRERRAHRIEDVLGEPVRPLIAHAWMFSGRLALARAE